MIAPRTGVAVVAGALLGQSVGLADRRVEVDGEWCVAGSGTGLPDPGQQLAAHPVQLADMAPPNPDTKSGSEQIQVGLPIETGRKATLRLRGTVPPEVWNRLGTRILPKLRSGDDLSVGVEFSVSVDADLSQGFQLELQQALDDLGLAEQVHVEQS